MALIDDFKARFLNEHDFTEDEIDEAWPMVEDEWRCFYNVDPDNWKDCEKTGALYIMAHLMVGVLDDSQGVTRQESSKSVGSVSVSYGANGMDNLSGDFFNTTKYGQRYLQLIQFNFGGHFV